MIAAGLLVDARVELIDGALLEIRVDEGEVPGEPAKDPPHLELGPGVEGRIEIPGAEGVIPARKGRAVLERGVREALPRLPRQGRELLELAPAGALVVEPGPTPY